MGQANSSTSDPIDSSSQSVKYQDFVQNYHFISKAKDQRYGEISLLQDKTTNEQVALREIHLKSDQDFEKDIELLKARSKITHSNIIKILRYTTKPEDLLRYTMHKILIIIEYLENDLEKEIKQRKAKNDYYKEEQLWFLIENVLKALAMLQKNRVVHGDIRPSSIFISKMGVYKVSQPGLTSSATTPYRQILNGSTNARAYLSPNQLASLQKNEAKPVHDPWKSDVFSLGMTLLHAATLNSCDNLYNWKTKTINQEEFEQRLSTLKIIYSDKLQKIIRSMLTMQENQRPDFLSLDMLVSGGAETTRNSSQLRPNPGMRGNTSDKPLEAEGSKTTRPEKRSKIGGLPMKALQENNPNFPKATMTSPPKKLTIDTDAPPKPSLPSSIDHGSKSPFKVFAGSPSHFENKSKPRVANENMLKKVIGEPHQNRFMNKTATKENSGMHITKEFSPSPNPLRSANPNLQGEFYNHNDLNQAPIFTSNLSTIQSDSKGTSTVGSLNDVQPKESITYKSLISSEVAQLMADFKSKMDRNRSPPNRTDNSDYLGQRENSASREYNSMRGSSSRLQGMMNPGTLQYAGSPTVQDKNAMRNSNGFLNSVARPPQYSELTISVPRDSSGMFQNPYNFGGYQPNQQIDSADKRNSAGWQVSPKSMQSPSNSNTNNFYVLNGYSSATTRQTLASPQNVRSMQQQIPGSPITSFESRMNNNSYQPHLVQQTKQNERYLQSANPSNSDPYMMSTRPKAQNFYEEPSSNDYDNMQPKESIRTSSYEPFRQSLASPKEAKIVTEKYPDGSVYRGQKRDGVCHGKGTFTYPDGGTYSGDWVAGLMEGQGTLAYAGGSKAYVGQWKEDKFHGKGAVYNEFPAKLQIDFDFTNFDNVGEHWVKYEGDFQLDHKQGTGTLFLTNGEKFHGQFREDMIDGVGMFYSRGGKVFKGEWWKNKLIRPL